MLLSVGAVLPSSWGRFLYLKGLGIKFTFPRQRSRSE